MDRRSLVEKREGEMMVEYKKIKSTDKIQYISIHPNFGRAEFQMCPVFKNGYMQKLYIMALQQERKDRFWVLGVEKKINQFSITSWIYKTDAPYIWKEFWCKEHKTICHTTYVPNDTNVIRFEYNFGNALEIRFGKESDL